MERWDRSLLEFIQESNDECEWNRRITSIATPPAGTELAMTDWSMKFDQHRSSGSPKPLLDHVHFLSMMLHAFNH